MLWGTRLNIWLMSAALLCAITSMVHVVLGGRDVARPLLEQQLGEELKFTLYLCWHITTIVLVGMSVALALASLGLASRDVAWLASIASLLFAVLNVGVVIRFRLPPSRFPQWVLFVPIALLGFAGLV